MSGPDGPGFAPVPLEEVLRTAELQTRVDRKYLVPHRAFAEFERGLAAQGSGPSWRSTAAAASPTPPSTSIPPTCSATGSTCRGAAAGSRPAPADTWTAAPPPSR
ncbi:hypothetical protein ACFQXA_31030 [Nocardiopsis composta]